MDDVTLIQIRSIDGQSEAEACACLMAASEPWITLRRDYRAALKIITDASREVYVAVGAEMIRGFVVLVMQGAFTGYIQSVCVDAEWRGQGIGSRLIQFAEQRILSVTPNVFLCVSSFNPAARRLYQRMGYEVIGELKDYIVPGYSEILMRKSIGPLPEFASQTQRMIANPDLHIEK